MARAAEARDAVDRFVDGWRRERPDLDLDALELSARIVHLAARIQGAWADAAAASELGAGALQVLLALRRVGAPFELTPTELCREAHVSSGGMTQLLDRLEARALVGRVPHPTDRRGLLVRMTAAGRGIADEVVVLRLGTARALLDGLGPGERRQLVSLLRKLLGSIERAPPAQAPASGRARPPHDAAGRAAG